MWGMMLASACLIQLGAGVLMDNRYDPKLFLYYPVAVLYPLVYWMLMSLITSIYSPIGFFRDPPEVQRWRIDRIDK